MALTFFMVTHLFNKLFAFSAFRAIVYCLGGGAVGGALWWAEGGILSILFYTSAPGGVAAPKILPRDFLYCSRSGCWY
jgi:hypothetical protein